MPTPAVFISMPSLATAVSDSECIFHIRVLDEIDGDTFPLKDKWTNDEPYFKLCQCQVIQRLKVSDNPRDLVHKALEQIYIACMADERYGSLEKGRDYIVFCLSGGLVPTVLNSADYHEVRDGKVIIAEDRLPDGEPDSDEYRTLTVEAFVKIVRECVDRKAKKGKTE